MPREGDEDSVPSPTSAGASAAAATANAEGWKRLAIANTEDIHTKFMFKDVIGTYVQNLLEIFTLVYLQCPCTMPSYIHYMYNRVFILIETSNLLPYIYKYCYKHIAHTCV